MFFQKKCDFLCRKALVMDFFDVALSSFQIMMISGSILGTFDFI